MCSNYIYRPHLGHTPVILITPLQNRVLNFASKQKGNHRYDPLDYMFSWFVALFRGVVFVWVWNFHCLMLFHWSCFHSRTLWICGSLLQTSFLSSMRFWWICVNSYQAASGAWDGGGWILGSSLIEPLPSIAMNTCMNKKLSKDKAFYLTRISWMTAEKNCQFCIRCARFLDGPFGHSLRSTRQIHQASLTCSVFLFFLLAGKKEYEIPKLWRSQSLARNAKRRIWAAFFFNDGLCMTRELNNMTAKIREGICVIHVNPRFRDLTHAKAFRESKYKQ